MTDDNETRVQKAIRRGADDLARDLRFGQPLTCVVVAPNGSVLVEKLHMDNAGEWSTTEVSNRLIGSDDSNDWGVPPPVNIIFIDP